MGVLDLIKELEKEGVTLVDALGGDEPVSPRVQHIVQQLIATAKDELYSDLLFAITYKSFPPEEAKQMWCEIVKHKHELNQRLNRNVGIYTATLDYLANHRQILQNVRIIDQPEMDRIMLFMNVDELTGVYNHRYFQERLREEIHRARRHKRLLSLLVIDLDHLKEYNDRFGHLHGDVVLREAAKLMKESVREIDIVARYGGDEYCIILPDTPKQGAVLVAERIRARAAEHPTLKAHAVVGGRVTFSIGVAEFPTDGHDPQNLISAADAALYESKRLGRDRVTVAPVQKAE